MVHDQSKYEMANRVARRNFQ